MSAGLLLLALALTLEAGQPVIAPFLAFFPAVVLSAWLAGLAPAIGVCAGSAVATWWFLIRPPGLVVWPSANQAAAVAAFIAVGLGTAALVDALASRAIRAEAALDRLERQVADAQEAHGAWRHRTANALQLVMAALSQQRRAVADPAGRQALDDAARRLMILARLQRPAGADSAPGALLHEVSRDVVDAATEAPAGFALEIDEAIRMDTEQLAAVAMLAAEVLAAALRPASQEQRPASQEQRPASQEQRPASQEQRPASQEQRIGPITLGLRRSAPGRAVLELRDQTPGRQAASQPLGAMVQTLADRLGARLAVLDEGGAVVTTADFAIKEIAAGQG